ncbi:MAG: ATP-binding protein [Cyanobacteria bacterium P01_F01_bin.150]
MDELTTQLQDSPIVKVKVFNPQGRTVFSTDLDQIGNDKSQAPPFLAARTGQVISQLGHRDTFKAVKQVLADRDLLSSYLPVRDNGEIVAVFELYTDVTPLLQRIEDTQRAIVVGSLLVLGLLYFILNIFVQWADTLIKQQYQQVQESENRYRQQSLELDIRVKQRTQELSETLEELTSTQAIMIYQEKMSALGALVAGVAHEINNPINFIHGSLEYLESYSETLLKSLHFYEQHYPEPDEQLQKQLNTLDDIEFVKEDMEKIVSSLKVGTQRIKDIVLSLRTFSRKDTAELKTVDIHDGIESTLMLLQHRLKLHPITIERHFGRLPFVECYASQLNQVFMNILSNGIDALDELVEQKTLQSHSSPKITISTVADSDNVCISIEDNGIGMPQTVQAQIFEPFFTTKSADKGTGIGMAISHQLIVEKHGGQIDCTSEKGIGTKFIIEIPIKQPQTVDIE